MNTIGVEALIPGFGGRDEARAAGRGRVSGSPDTIVINTPAGQVGIEPARSRDRAAGGHLYPPRYTNGFTEVLSTLH